MTVGQGAFMMVEPAESGKLARHPKIVPTLKKEESLFQAGAVGVVGFDEVGRGSLAGPVMVGAALLLAPDTMTAVEDDARTRDGGLLERSQRKRRILAVPEGLADSKMLSKKKREALFEPLQGWVDAWAVGGASNKEIDQWGISHALGVAALRALQQVEQMALAAGLALADKPVDGILDGPYDYIVPTASSMDAPDLGFLPHVSTQVKGDVCCAVVSAASVLAKVVRDRLMEGYARDPRYQAYGWDSNKGYGSAAHRAAIAEYGPSDLHRLTWHLC